jgi:methylated-DNA-[protein]-cysteine S-methyltransferase
MRRRHARGASSGTDFGRAAVPGVLAPFGPVGLRLDGQVLVGIEFLGDGVPLRPPRSAPETRVADALLAYFADPSRTPQIPIEPRGTPFRRKVWEALRKIPSGRTMSYGELAAMLGTSARAVGGACRANPIPVLVPCHRVVGSSGIGGFAGRTAGRLVGIKGWLLAHEQGGA